MDHVQFRIAMHLLYKQSLHSRVVESLTFRTSCLRFVHLLVVWQLAAMQGTGLDLLGAVW
jgi:hypothetical protein